MFLNKLITENESDIEKKVKLKEKGKIAGINMTGLIPSFNFPTKKSFYIIYDGEFNGENMRFEDVLVRLFREFKLYENNLCIRITDEIISEMEDFKKKSFKEILENKSSKISKHFSNMAEIYQEELIEDILEFFYIIMKYTKFLQDGKIEKREENCEKLREFKKIFENLKEKIQKNTSYKNKEIINRHIEFYILNIEERLFLFGERNFDDKNIEISYIREKILKWILKNKYYENLSLEYFLSTPLRLEMYFYLKTVLKMTAIVDNIYPKNRKGFYEEFFERDEKGNKRDSKNKAIIGNGYLNGYRQVSLAVINRFINRYKDDKAIKGYDIGELYFDYLKSNQIYSLISINYSFEKIPEYETEVLYKEKFIYPKNKDTTLSWGESKNLDNNIEEGIYEITVRDTKFKIDEKKNDKVEIGETYYIELNIDNIANNIEEFKRFLNKNDKNLIQKDFLKEKYLNCNLFLIEKENSYYDRYIVVTCTDIRDEYCFCQFKKKFIGNNRREFFQIVLKRNDFNLIGEVLEEKIIYRNY